MLNKKQRAEFEARLRNAFLAANSRHADELLRLLGNPPEVANVPAAFWASLSAALVGAIEPLVVEMAVASAIAMGKAQAVSTSVDWTLINERAAKWADRYTFQLVTAINANTRTMLQKEVARFFRDAGQDLRGLARDVQPGLPDLVDRLGRIIRSESRAEMVAITEVTRAASQGEAALVAEIRAANPSVQVVEIWLTSRDEFVCEVCGPLHGKRRGVDWQDPPPAHPRCRCAIATELVGLQADDE